LTGYVITLFFRRLIAGHFSPLVFVFQLAFGRLISRIRIDQRNMTQLPASVMDGGGIVGAIHQVIAVADSLIAHDG
jgi:hypothetical protein